MARNSRRHFVWYRSVKLWFAIIVLGILGCVLALTVGKPFVKQFRSDQLLAESIALRESDDLLGAFQKAHAAHLLAPDSPEASLHLARLGTEVRHPNALELWKKAIDLPGRSIDDLKSFAELAVDSGRKHLAGSLILRLKDEAPDDIDTSLLEIRYLGTVRELGTAFVKADALLEAGVDEAKLHSWFAQLALSIPKEEWREKGLEHLRGLSQRQNEVGRDALRYLIHSRLDSDERFDFARRLREHPLAQNSDLLMAYQIEIMGDRTSYDACREQILKAFDLEDESERLQLVNGLAFLGEAGAVLEILKSPRLVSNRQLQITYLNARLQLGEAQAVYDWTVAAHSEPLLSEAEKLFIRARALAALGEQQKYSDALKLAAEVVEMKDFFFGERELTKHKGWDLLLKLYARYAVEPRLETYCRAKRVLLFYQLNREGALSQELDLIELQDYSKQPNVQFMMACIHLLNGRSVREAREVSEMIVASAPSIAEYRVVLALAMHLFGRSKDALDLISNVPEALMEMRPYNVVSAAVYAANDDLEKARHLLGDVSKSQLLSSEVRLVSELL